MRRDSWGEAEGEREEERAIPAEDATVVIPVFAEGSFYGDRFRIERLLARGGMGAVYQATDLRLGTSVALKVLRRSSGKRDPELVARFEREIQILEGLEHPGIVSIHGSGVGTDGTPWLAMELLEGQTLREFVQQGGPLSLGQLVPIANAACQALQVAHEHGVVHRDLKPDNIFLPKAGGVRLLDFGLSVHADNTRLTGTGAIIGTPRYMSPEQIASARSADARTDIYAMGVILFEALAGCSPFTASDHGQLLGAILQGRREQLMTLRPELPSAVDRVLAKAMDRDPLARHGTALGLAEAFHRAAFDEGSSRPPLGSAAAPLRGSGKGRSPQLVWLVLLMLLGLATGAFGAYLLTR
ncbi:MAG: serine/threonine protein kinase [Myxococcales bacterium]|nr:serine/threonine protein kinase [Myxococcales bacterium]